MKLTREASRHNFRQVEKEWQWEFVFYVLEEMGFQADQLDECIPESGDFSEINVKHKIKLRELLHSENVKVIDDLDGGIKIYIYVPELEEYILTAEWKKCRFVFKENLKEVEASKRLGVEIEADIWMSFEEEEENE